LRKKTDDVAIQLREYRLKAGKASEKQGWLSSPMSARTPWGHEIKRAEASDGSLTFDNDLADLTAEKPKTQHYEKMQRELR